MNKYLFVSFLCLACHSTILAQGTPNVKFINMSEMLPYIFPFYVVTMLSLGLFLHKLMRPKFPTRWLYISTLIAIIGSGVLALKFEDFKTANLTPSDQEKTRINENVVRAEKSDQNELMADFWRISLPNVTLLLLGMLVDYKNKQEATQIE